MWSTTKDTPLLRANYALLLRVLGKMIPLKRLAPNYIIPSFYPLVTNKNDGAGWRKSRGEICAIIFAVTEPPLQSLKGLNDGANFPITWSGKINLRTFESTTIRTY